MKRRSRPDFLRAADENAADDAICEIRAVGVEIIDVLPENLWKAAGQHKVGLRRISLADCFCLAFANSYGARVVTSDRKEFEPVRERNLNNVLFIR